MPDAVYIGGVAATATHIGTLTLSGTWETDDIVDFVVSNENFGTTTTLSVTVTSTSISTICTNLAAAWNASTHYLLTPVTAAAANPNVTFTADNVGIRHYITPTTRDSGGAQDSQVTAYTSGPSNISPYDYQSPDNWLARVFPSNADNINFNGLMAAAISYGLVNSLTPANVNFDCPAYAIGTTTAPLRLGIPTGSVRVTDILPDGSRGTMTNLINMSCAAATLDVRGTASQGSSGLAPFTIAGGTFTLNQTGGNLGMGLSTPGEASTLAATTTLSGGTFVSGTGTVWTGKTIVNTGSAAFLNSAGSTTTLTQTGGTTTIDGVAKLAYLNLNGGTLYANMRVSGNEIDEVVATGGGIDFSQDLDGWTIGTLTVAPSAGTITITRGVNQGGTISNVGSLTFPTGKKKLTFGAG